MIKLGLDIADDEEDEEHPVESTLVPIVEGAAEDSVRMEEVD